MDIYQKIDEIGEYIEQAKVVPVLNQKLLDVDYLMRSLEELYSMIPAEIKEAKELLNQLQQREADSKASANELMEKTKSECTRLMEIARIESRKLIDGHELRLLAEEQAKQIQSETIDEVERVRAETLVELEQMRRESLERARELEDASQHRARESRLVTEQYADEVLTQIEGTLSQISTVSKNCRKYFANQREKDIMTPRAAMNN